MCDINEYLKEHKKLNEIYLKYSNEVYITKDIMPPIECADGLTLSVQASRHHYCMPRVDDADYYTEVEIGFPNQYIPELEVFSDGGGVYGYVPVEVVNEILEKHGGIK
jgi:hypothetical protein